MNRAPQKGDYVRYKLPCGVEGTCLLLEEGESLSEPDVKMFTGQKGNLEVVSLYSYDVVAILKED